MNAHSLPERMQAWGQQAKTASAAMAKASAAQKSAALRHLAQRLRQEAPALIEANRQDVERAQASGLEGPMLDRLKLTLPVLETCAVGCEQLATMPDVIGDIIGMKQIGRAHV